MASSTGLEDLPIDALEHIARYISANDLSSCCAVSRTLRHNFNDDIFWKKYCNTKLDDYLQNSDSCVEPKLSLPKEKTSTLTDVGKCRLNYMRQQRLWGNWRSGRFKVDEIEPQCRPNFIVKVEFVANNYVFIHTVSETQVWDVSNPSNLIMTIRFFFQEGWRKNFYKVVGNKLIVVQCNFVQVFNICLVSNSWSFEFAFFFDQSEEFSASLTTVSDIAKCYKAFPYYLRFDEEVVRTTSGEFFIGFLTDPSLLRQPVMYIWNINTGKKVKEQTCENIIELSGIPKDIGLETSCTSSQKILVILYTDRNEHQSSFIFVYNLSQLDFSHWSGRHDGKLTLFNDPFICTHSFPNIHILFCGFNSKCAGNVPELMQNYSLSRPSYARSIKALGKNFIVMSLEYIQILNTSTKTWNSLFHVNRFYNDFEIVNDRFIVIFDYDIIAEVWELGNKPKKMFFPPVKMGKYRTVNDAGTKIVLEGELVPNHYKMIVLNFW